MALAARRSDRARRPRGRPRTLVAVEGGRRVCPGQRHRRADAGHCAERGRAGGLQRRCRRRADQPAADARARISIPKSRAGRSTASASELKTDRYFHGIYYPEGVPGRRPQICPWPCRAGAAGRGAHLRGHAGRQHRSFRHSQAHRHAVGAAARVAYRARRQRPSRRAAAAAVGNAAAGLALCRGDRAARRAAVPTP